MIDQQDEEFRFDKHVIFGLFAACFCANGEYGGAGDCSIVDCILYFVFMN